MTFRGFILGTLVFGSLVSATPELLRASPELSQSLNSLIQSLEKMTLVEKIKIIGNEHLTEQDILPMNTSSRITGKINLYSILSGNLEQEISNNPWLNRAELKFDPLQWELTVSVSERIPTFLLVGKRHSWILSSDGKILETRSLENNSNLPKLFLSEPRDTANDAIVLAKYIELFIHTGREKLPIETGTLLQDGSVLITLKGIPTKIHYTVDSSYKTLEAQKESLEKTRILLDQTLSDLRRRNEIATELDLRFENQVVVRF